MGGTYMSEGEVLLSRIIDGDDYKILQTLKGLVIMCNDTVLVYDLNMEKGIFEELDYLLDFYTS